MSKSHYRSKPAAMVVTAIALSFALADSAVAETNTAKVRRIARNVANEQISIRAPGLSVSSAVSAQSANTANFASSANPVLFAHVGPDGTVDPANSKGVSQANVTSLGGGFYCFGGLPAIKGGQVTTEFNQSQAGGIGQFGFGSPGRGECPRATQFFVTILNPDAGGVLSKVASSYTCTSSSRPLR